MGLTAEAQIAEAKLLQQIATVPPKQKGKRRRTEPQWDEEVHKFDIVDQYQMEMLVYDEDMLMHFHSDPATGEEAVHFEQPSRIRRVFGRLQRDGHVEHLRAHVHQCVQRVVGRGV